ncbi:putative inorganic phosphate cotransporter [Aricia agestis]|uniref:putative inorganic phosphate cotransporter n=1 Tax=Aricia agestis TaxID=91739 RepID=UPI001C209D0B|nr:putative inorganic phosphate cotransporter [Aricia agestis]
MDAEFLRYNFEDGHDGIITKTSFKLGVRHIQMVYMALCSLALGTLRSSTAVAVLAVADHTRVNDTYIQIHDWDRRTQGSVLSAFLMGYAIALFPAERYLKQAGDKLILTAVLLINGGLAAAMPTIINKGGWAAAVNAQLFAGMSQACLTPVQHHLSATWLLPSERRMFSYAIHTALHLGTIIAFPISGALTRARLGWELVCYAQAMGTLAVATMWVLLTSSTPDKHEAVGDKEKEMIRDAMETYKQKNLPLPWRRIVRSRNFWGLAGARAASNVLFIFCLTELPALFYSLNRSVEMSSIQAAFPLATLWLVYTLTAPVAKFAFRVVRFNYVFDMRYFRKVINGFGALGVCLCLVVTPHLLPGWPRLAVMMMIVSQAFVGLQYSGFLENHSDVTENFASSLLMMTGVVGAAVGALVPLTCGAVVGDDVSNPSRWKVVFSGVCVVYAGGHVVYSALASVDRQPWDQDHKPKIGYNNDASNMELDDIDVTSTCDLDMRI